MKRLLTLPCLGFTLFLSAQKNSDTITIIGVGDVMLGTSFPKKMLPPNDGRMLLANVAPYLQKADFTFGNYEGTLFDGEGLPKKCLDSNKCFAFKSPERYVSHLKAAGFSAMSVANNHSGDFGLEGRGRTLAVLQSAGIAACGTDERPYDIIV
ncbi:MAG TPA: CapA family protein, partial [Flavisolibacter sp.]|nr:CapA family protein [Flavisolibacter sp.]